MFKEIRVYYEGDALLKPGFSAFFHELQDRAQAKGLKFRLISAKGNSVQDFATANKANPSAWNILLKDSEKPHAKHHAAAFCRKQGLDISRVDSIFWMVEMMESWFHADKDAMEVFYGKGFKKSALKQNPKVEEISKRDLESGLSAATRKTKKGDYLQNKTSHGPKLLELIKPDRVRAAAPNCERLFAAVLQRLS